MKHYINIFFIKHYRLVAFIFPILAIFRLINEDHALEDCLVGVDDWNRYARNAIDIIENGWLMPSINENYLLPSGFLYNYFIALIFFLFTPNIELVYFIQSILLSIAIIITHITFFKNSIYDKFLLYALIVFSYFDIFKYYTFKLLSESLAIFTLAVFFYFLLKALNTSRSIHLIFSFIFLGASCLIRPTVLPFSIILLIVLLKKNYLKEKINGIWISIFTFSFMLSTLSLRNYLITKTNPLTIFNDLVNKHTHTISKFNIIDEPFLYVIFLIKKLFFVFGLLPIIEPNYNIRPHWLVLWLGLFTYVFKCYLSKKNTIVQYSEKILVLFILSFFSTILLLTPVESYGFRMVLPGLFYVLIFSHKGWSSFFVKKINH